MFPIIPAGMSVLALSPFTFITISPFIMAESNV
jgi:hypothetical protein